MMAPVAERITLADDGRYEAMVLARFAQDPTTDVWFLVERTLTRRGARRVLARFVARVTSRP